MKTLDIKKKRLRLLKKNTPKGGSKIALLIQS